MSEPRTIVIGAGLAGLTAAAELARSGQRVLVLDAAEHVGGRARSRHRDGYDINLGPHALYRTGGGLQALRSLGVRVTGRRPRLDRAGVYVDGAVAPALRHLRAGADRLRVTRALTGLSEHAAGDWEGRPTREWVDSVTDAPAGRAIVASVVRTATYCADLDLLDAGAAVRQLRRAAHGVLYLHHGWSTLVGALADVVRSRGGEIRTGCPVAAVDHDDVARGVRLADGTELTAAAVVVALGDARRTARLLTGGAAATLDAVAATTVPVRMAHLDIAVRPLPARRFPNVLGIDEPVYITVPSAVASVAPAGGAVIHVARYLRPDEEDGDHRAILETVLDVAQPEWRDHVIDARYVPRSMVSGDHPRPATRGTAGRAGVDVAGVGGLAVAGDWVGPSGLLADASILSGVAAAHSVMGATTPRRDTRAAV